MTEPLNVPIKTNVHIEKWYTMEKFPLIPIIFYRKPDKYNTAQYQFLWLFFKFWSMDSFSFEFSFVFDSHWGLGITAMVPYLRIIACIPMPFKIQMWIYMYLNRKPSSVKKENKANYNGE